MPKKDKATKQPKNADKLNLSVVVDVPAPVAISEKEANKANEKRRKKLDKVSRRIQEINVMMKINDKDKKHYGKKLNKCIKKDSKLQEELDELLKKEQELQ